VRRKFGCKFVQKEHWRRCVRLSPREADLLLPLLLPLLLLLLLLRR